MLMCSLDFYFEMIMKVYVFFGGALAVLIASLVCLSIVVAVTLSAAFGVVCGSVVTEASSLAAGGSLETALKFFRPDDECIMRSIVDVSCSSRQKTDGVNLFKASLNDRNDSTDHSK